MTVYNCVVISALTFSMNFLKLRYHDPRPFWSSDQVQAFSCSRQYGNPSGHSMTAFCSALLFALDSGRSDKRIRILFALLFGSSVAYSRLFLGVHSLDQVLFGSLIGIWLACTLHYICKAPLLRHFNQIISRQDRQYKRWIQVSLGLMAVVYLALIGNYYTV